MSRIKAFSRLKRTIRASQLDLISDAVATVCSLCNFQSPPTDTRTGERFNINDFLLSDADSSDSGRHGHLLMAEARLVMAESR